jgi:hypothetical protein
VGGVPNPSRAVGGSVGLRSPGEYAQDLRLAAAAKLYELGRVSQEVAADIAGTNRGEFLKAIEAFQVSPFQDTPASLRAELERG